MSNAGRVSLKDRVILITGASRGIGREIAVRCAREGAKIAIAAKTEDPDDKLPGTIYSVAEEISAAGSQALALKVDVRDEGQIQSMVKKTIESFGHIDVLINNAGAISLTSTLETSAKRFDLMHQINQRATFLCCQAAMPYLAKSNNPHILNISPPISLEPHWFKDHLAYTMSKYGMSMVTLGLAAEFRKSGIAVNSLWPKRVIATAAIKMLMGEAGTRTARKPAIMADAAYFVLTSQSRDCTGNFFLDEEVLAQNGITKFTQYASPGGGKAAFDLYVKPE